MSTGKFCGGPDDALDALIRPLNVAADYVDKISKGCIPEKITEEYHGDFKGIRNNLNNCIEQIAGVTGELNTLVRAASSGDISKRGNEQEFQGRYREIIHSMNGLMESMTNPLNELIEVLNRLAVNDYTQKMAGEYVGIWDALKYATNEAQERMVGIQRLAIKMSDGDMGSLEVLREIGRRSENDKLVPSFTKMMETVIALITDVDTLAEAAVEGKLSTRADATKHPGEYRKVIEGVNATLDAVLLPVNEAAACLREMAMGNLDVEMKGNYNGDHAVIKENLNATLASLNDVLNQVTVAVDQVATGARQVSDSSQSLSQASTESASSLEEISASMHELTSQTNMNAENATQANQLAALAKVSAEKGNAGDGQHGQGDERHQRVGVQHLQDHQGH